MKRCSKCGEEKERSGFHKASTPDGLHGHCRACRSLDGKQYYKTHHRKVRQRVRKYLTTYRGACVAIWLHIRQRCEGRSKSAQQYAGLPYCSKKQFLVWAYRPENKAEWSRLVRRFRRTGTVADRPCVDRLLDSRDVGYVPGNMRWTTHGNNASKANMRRWYGIVAPNYMKENVL